jgi:KUP system potassium uptake protein
LETLSNDQSLPKFSSHLIYLTKANNPKQIEKRIISSIFDNNAKRADLYWMIHLETTDQPYTMEYGVEELKNDKVIRVDFRLGFRVQPRVGLMLRKVVDEMINNKELDIVSRYPSVNKEDLQNFRFVVLEKFLSYDNEFSVRDGFILNSYFSINRMALSDSKAYGLDSNQTIVEKIPMVVTPVSSISLKRAFYKIDSKC